MAGAEAMAGSLLKLSGPVRVNHGIDLCPSSSLIWRCTSDRSIVVNFCPTFKAAKGKEEDTDSLVTGD